MTTYTQPEGTADDTYFQDVKINPVTVADGTLHARLDQKRYPQVGLKSAISLIVDTVAPATLVHGTSGTLTVDGDQFTDDTVVTFSGAGITVNSVENVDNEGRQLRVAITATVGAAIGARNLTVTNLDGGTATATGALTLLVTPVTVTSASPLTIDQGTTGDLIITGTGFNASAAATFSGTGITVNSSTRNSATSLTANVTVAGGATASARDITVTNTDTGSGTGVGKVTVTVPISVVTISTVLPATVAQGSTGDVVITGTGFNVGAVTTVSGAGVTVNSTTRDSATQLTVNVTVAGGAATTARNVTVTNTDTGTHTATGALTVTV